MSPVTKGLIEGVVGVFSISIIVMVIWWGSWFSSPKPTPSPLLTQSELERAIEDWIITKNPNATIKEFRNFPSALLAHSRLHELDFRLVLAMCDKESEMNPRAVSPKGAIGLCQIMPATAAAIVKNQGETFKYVPPLKGNLGSLGEPSFNVTIAILYLKDQIAQFGLNRAALQAYNRGPAKAQQWWPTDHYAGEVALLTLAVHKALPHDPLLKR